MRSFRTIIGLSPKSIVVFATICAGSMASADTISVPSGQPLSFLEFISEDEGNLVRFRFLTPQIGTGYD